MAEVIMPKMGDAMTEGKVLRWMKHPGDRVEVGEALAEIETDKVNVELPAEETGVLTQIVVSEGGVAPVGGTIAMIARPGEAAPETPGPSAQPQAAPPPAAAKAPAAPGKPAAPAPAATRASADERIKASPLARRMAAEQGIDLSQVEGTGPEGRITKEDLEAFMGRGAGAPAATAPPAPGAPTPAAPARPPAAPVPATPGADVALTRMRQTIARRMSESKQQVPHFYVTVEILMDEAAKAREQLNAEVGEKVVSLNDLILKAAAVALRAFPNLNATFMGETVRRHDEIHMGFAVALPEGLLVPVIRDCDRKTIPEIAREAKGIGERARSGKLHPSELQGGTFTVSNLGMFDVDSFVAIINPPQAGILAVGSAGPQPVAEGDRVRVARVMKATISADHRVTDGAEAARYLGEVKRLLQEPTQL